MNRVTIIFTRRYINLESISASASEIPGIHRYTIVVKETEDKVKKLIGQLNKQIDVLKAFYHENKDTVYQEIALFKVPTTILAAEGKAELILRRYSARILSVQPEYTVIEKTGHKSEILALYDELAPYGILEFNQSGRISISKPMKELKDYLLEIERASEH